MNEAVIYETEAEFRQWFDKNLGRFGISEVILSQEVCPDYVVRMNDGSVKKVEAELFAINFRYHGHDPKKVDLIVACYSKTDSVDGVPVLAVNKFWPIEETVDEEPAIPAEAPLSDIESKILGVIDFHGGVSIQVFANDYFGGDQDLWKRMPPEIMSHVPRGNFGDSIFSVMTMKTKEWMKKYHHVLVGSGLSAQTCQAINSLTRRGLIKARPLDYASAIYDGGDIPTHPAWVPTELQVTPLAYQIHGEEIRNQRFS